MTSSFKNKVHSSLKQMFFMLVINFKNYMILSWSSSPRSWKSFILYGKNLWRLRTFCTDSWEIPVFLAALRSESNGFIANCPSTSRKAASTSTRHFIWMTLFQNSCSSSQTVSRKQFWRLKPLNVKTFEYCDFFHWFIS